MDTKQVIVIRRDLKTRRGKEIAQGAHASMAFMSHLLRRMLDGEDTFVAEPVMKWIQGSFAKIVCQVKSEEELMAIHEKARVAGLESHLIQDSGRTEFDGVPTYTAVAIGPDEVSKIDAVTGELDLY